MLGSPLRRALLAFLTLLALAYPLHLLTRAETAAPSETARPAPVEAQVRLQIAFTSAPASFRVLHLGKEAWQSSEPATEMVRELKMAFPAEGVDLQFQADFSAGAPLAAMRVRLTDPAGDEHEKSLWGTGRIDGALTFP